MTADFIPDPEVPEGAIPTAALLVVLYIRPDGDNGYSIATRGEGTMTSYLGMTVLAQKEIMNWVEDR